MERGTKRKAAPSSTPAAEARPQKRQRTPGDPQYVPETSETVASATEMGEKFLKQLKSARDKNGRLIATDFLTLPGKREFPLYYEQILMPIAIDTLEAKLEQQGYPTLSTLESDVKRMVSNAKSFNETSSDIYQDAERIRKMTSNFMVKHNPAYKDKDYVAFPTPFPSELAEEKPVPTAAASKPTPAPPRAVAPPRTLKLTASAPAPVPVPAQVEADEPEDEEETEEIGDGNYKGKTFQEAQDQIVLDIMRYKDPESELEIFYPFVNLPSRTLTDYYNVIKQPLSLKAMQKRVRGVHGRHDITGVTDFKSWDSFETEFSRIWQNAREYNEDGSEMFNTSLDLERIFKALLAKVKREVDEPAQPILKLNLGVKPPPIKLRLGSAKASPGPARPDSITPTSNTAGITVDQAALQRQKELVQAGSKGIKLSKTPAAETAVDARPTANPPVQPTLSRTASATGKDSPIVDGVQSDSKQTPVVGVLPSATDVPIPSATVPSIAMPPPAVQGPIAPSAPGGGLQLASPAPHVPYHVPSTGLDSKWRPEGKDATSALLSNLLIITHPDLRVSKPLNVNVPAHPTLSQQSVTLTLPPTHTSLRFYPTLHPSLVAYSAYSNPLPALANSSAPLRPYKLFVTSNGQRIQSNPAATPPPVPASTSELLSTSLAATQSTPNGIPSTSTSPSQQQITPSSHIKPQSNTAAPYDVKLVPGINRIEIEIVSAVPPPVGKQAQAQVPALNTRGATAVTGGLELERVSVFVHLMRGA